MYEDSYFNKIGLFTKLLNMKFLLGELALSFKFTICDYLDSGWISEVRRGPRERGVVQLPKKFLYSRNCWEKTSKGSHGMKKIKQVLFTVQVLFFDVKKNIAEVISPKKFMNSVKVSKTNSWRGKVLNLKWPF